MRPLLWDTGFACFLRGELFPGLGVISYAADTLDTTWGGNFEDMSRSAIVRIARVVKHIEALGLRVALTKTEALLFRGPRRRPLNGATIMVASFRVPVQAHINLVLDGSWSFDEHFIRLAPKFLDAASALEWLLPKLDRPIVGFRRLYTGVIRSITLYGTLVWVDSLTT